MIKKDIFKMKTPPFNKLKKMTALAACLLIFGVIISCNKKQSLNADHPAIMQRLDDSIFYLTDKEGLKKAVKNFDDGFGKIKAPGIGDQIAYYKSKQRAYMESFHWDFAKIDARFCLSYSDSILQLIKKNNAEKQYERQYLATDIFKGDIYYYALRKYDTALNYYFKDKALIDRMSPCDQVDFTNRFAVVDYKENKYRQAASLFLREFNQRLSCNSTDFEGYASTQRALDNAGACYIELAMSDSAIYCFNKVIAYVDQYAYLYPLHKRFVMDVHGVASGYMGKAYYDKGDYKRAEQYFKESIRLNSHGGNEGKYTQEVQLELARLYLTTGRLKQADSMATEVKRSMDTLSNDAAILQWQKFKADYLNFAGDTTKGSYYFAAYLKLKNTANQVTGNMIQNDVDSYFREVQGKYDQAILKNEQEHRNQQLIIFIIVTLFILFVLFQIWNNWRVARKNNAELAEVNRQTTELNASLQRTLTTLERSQAENMRLLQVVAHDLRDPIGSMFALATIMLDTPGHSETDRTILQLIKTSGQNSMGLVNDLLKVDIKPGEIKEQTVDLAEMLRYCVAQLKNKAAEKLQDLTLQTQPCAVPGSPEKLWRVISNLISNAIKFSPVGAGIDIMLRETIDGATITVKDKGIGIPEEIKEEIFNMFTDARRTGTAGEQPFGMGLAISKQIVDAHGGRIWFDSEPGSGTTFYVELKKADK